MSKTVIEILEIKKFFPFAIRPSCVRYAGTKAHMTANAKPGRVLFPCTVNYSS